MVSPHLLTVEQYRVNSLANHYVTVYPHYEPVYNTLSPHLPIIT